MAEELDEFGIPVRNSKPTVDEFGIPLKKKSLRHLVVTVHSLALRLSNLLKPLFLLH